MRRLIFWSTVIAACVGAGLSFWAGPWWLLLLLVPVLGWLWASLRPGCAWWGPVMKEFPTRRREALLTFDLAPHEAETLPVLELLDAGRATALFFVTGAQAMRYPELLKAIVAKGHALGLHGMSFQPGHFWWWSRGHLRSEVETALRVLKQIVPEYQVQWFRAPGGRCNPWLHPLLREHGLQLVTWSASDGHPRRRDFDRTVIAMRRDIHQGAIIALHHGLCDQHGQPVVCDLVQELLLWLRGQGYRFGADSTD